MARLEIEHIIPISRGGTSEEENLWLSCPLCNKAKSERIDWTDPETSQIVRLFHPRTDSWHDHFAWSADGLRIVGKAPIGRATVARLHLDSDPDAILVRSYWVQAGWHPPTE
jgi:HNH endonuclease